MMFEGKFVRALVLGLVLLNVVFVGCRTSPEKQLLGLWYSDEGTIEFFEDGTVIMDGDSVGNYTILDDSRLRIGNLVVNYEVSRDSLILSDSNSRTTFSRANSSSAQGSAVTLIPSPTPVVIVLNSNDLEGVGKTTEELGEGVREVNVVYSFDYVYDDFPESLLLHFTSDYKTNKLPFASFSWVKPDGGEIRLGDLSLNSNTTFHFSQDVRLLRRLRGVPPNIGLFSDWTVEEPTVLKGTYQLLLTVTLWDLEDSFDATLIIEGPATTN